MIYYFSGTGNSKSAAKALAHATGCQALFIPHCNPYEQSIADDNSVGFVFPVYAWGVPPIVLDFISRLPQSMVDAIRIQRIPVWTVAVCGDETGKAVDMLRKSLAKRGVTLNAAWSLQMPNVYVLLPGFGVDKKELEQKKLHEAKGRIAEIAAQINGADWKFNVHEGSFPRLKTMAVYPLFSRWGVDPRRWHAEDTCIGCGKCADVCPVANISMLPPAPSETSAQSDGNQMRTALKPNWGNDCTSCCACFHACPVNAVQYASITSRYAQYLPLHH